jgi:predicted dehydrogenase
MRNGALRVAVVGCGNISGPYGETIAAYPAIEIAGATDVDRALSAGFVQRFGGIQYPSLDELLADRHVDAIVNLTSHGVHAEVTTAALEAGKHVHTEKPLAASYREALSLVELADARGLRLSCSPITFMGDAQEAAWRLIASGAIGTVRVAYAEVNWGRIETWHPRPEPFYRIGPLADVGVYPLTILTAMFGPARRVTAFGTVLLPERVTASGEPFAVGASDFGVAVVELADGPVVRLTTSFYVMQHSKQRGIEFHGDDGSLFLSSWQNFDAAVELARNGGAPEPVLVPHAYPGTDWGRAVAELSSAIAEGRPHRASGSHAAHVVEILDAIVVSAEGGRPVELVSSFERPPAPEPSGNGSGPG